MSGGPAVRAAVLKSSADWCLCGTVALLLVTGTVEHFTPPSTSTHCNHHTLYISTHASSIIHVNIISFTQSIWRPLPLWLEALIPLSSISWVLCIIKSIACFFLESITAGSVRPSVYWMVLSGRVWGAVQSERERETAENLLLELMEVLLPQLPQSHSATCWSNKHHLL